ncbi:putative ribonuclease H-like domain-containing protein [Tanacetum coccineum]
MIEKIPILQHYDEIDGRICVPLEEISKGGKNTREKLNKELVNWTLKMNFVKELKFNLFSISQMCDKKNSVHFTDTACVVLSPDFKLTDENHVLLKVPRKDNMYSVDLNNVVPQGGLTCLFEKDTPYESNLCHRRLGQGIKMEFSVARTSQQNGVAKRKNMTLIEAARTMLADLKLPTTFWAEAINIACYVKNKVLIIKPHNKTPYELFLGRKPALSFMRPFGCPVTILNTIDHLGKFDRKADEGFFVGYSTNSKAFRVFNSRTRIVEENLHVQFSENTPNITGSGPNWLFDIDALTMSMNYKLIVTGNQSNDPPFSSSSKDSPDVGFKPSGEEEKKDVEDPGNKDSEVLSTKEPRVNQEKDVNVNSTNNINIVSSPVNAAGIQNNVVDENIIIGCADDLTMPELEEIGRFSDDEDDNSGADMNNLDTYFQVSPVPTTRIHKDHPIEQIIGDLNSAPQTRRMTRILDTPWFKDERGIVIKNKARLAAQGYTQEERINYDEVFAPVARIKAIRLFLAYASFKDFVVYHMNGKSAFLYGKIKEEVYVCQSPGFEDLYFLDRVYKVEKALYGLHQAPRAWYVKHFHVFVDDIFLWVLQGRKDVLLEFEKMMHKKFQMSSMGELTFFLGLQVKQKEDGIFISQDKYVNEILNKFGFSDVKTARTPMETQKALLKDADGEDVDEHLYRSMIGSLMYLTSLRPDIMFATKIYIDNKSTICIVKNPVFHSKTKHIEIRYNFIRDSNEKKLIQMIKIHTDQNVADLLTKAFDIQALVDKKKVITIETSVRCDLQLEDAEGTECLPNATIFEQLTLMGEKTFLHMRNCLHIQKPLLSGEDSLKLNELMEIYTNLQNKVLDLETSKIAQAQEITSLKQIVKKLEKKKKSITPGLKRLRKGRKIADIDADVEVTLIDEPQGRNDEDLMFDTGVLDEQEVEVENVVSTAKVEVTTASATTQQHVE